MKIYTYYEDINFRDQDPLLRLWELSWRRNGFIPIILSSSHAKKHPYYDEFISRLELFHVKVKGNPLVDYGLACFVRWMAYSTQKNEKFYVSDYDVMNNGFKPVEPNEKLHFMHSTCPCLASGTPEQFEELIRLFVSLSESRLSELREVLRENRWYHDQEFVRYNLKFLPDSFMFTRNKSIWNKNSLVHFSNYHMKKLKQAGITQSRVDVVEEFLKVS
jgi:hypothetical protein